MRLGDIWSLGITLFLMMTFNLPFFPNGGLSEEEKSGEYRKMRKRQYPFPKNLVLSYECLSLILQLLEADEYSRMDCKQILSNQWFETDLNHTKRRPVPPINPHSANFQLQSQLQSEPQSH
jgi:serine/threonine protein kinase